VRTAIAVVGFGIGAVRLGPGTGAVWSEIALLVTGAIVVFVAFLRLRYVHKRISDEKQMPDDSPLADGLLLVLILALFGMLVAFACHVFI
jgi:putative membrane protein